jgi:hypothetical protein
MMDFLSQRKSPTALQEEPRWIEELERSASLPEQQLHLMALMMQKMQVVYDRFTAKVIEHKVQKAPTSLGATSQDYRWNAWFQETLEMPEQNLDQVGLKYQRLSQISEDFVHLEKFMER